MTEISIKINFRLVAIVLGASVLALSTIHFLTLVAQYAFGYDFVKGFTPLFRLNGVGNIPTLYGAVVLLTTSALCGLIGLGHRQTNTGRPLAWFALAAIAFLLSFDEASQIHQLLDVNERWTENMRARQPTMIEPWVIVYAIALLGLAIAFLPFFLSLTRRYQILFGGAATIFVVGGLGLEIVSAIEFARFGPTLKFEAISSAEEMMEMSAVAVLVVALLDYMKTTFGWDEIRITGAP